MERKIAIIGLGYVGLPLALAFARKFETVIGFDISTKKIDEIKRGIDPTKEGLEAALRDTSLKVTAHPDDLKEADFFIVGVPTPVDINHTPDLRPIRSACEIIGKRLSQGNIVVFESTVYPGVTEEVCGPLLEQHSGLKQGKDFFLGYSPERINPGDQEHTLERVTKVVSGESPAILKIVSDVYKKVVTAGVHEAPCIKVAEAAKVIENTQRDLNIALMNELAIIFDKMGIATRDVLQAAGTKWNFLKFSPGLVGGHCIGVDPYYLTTKAEQLGYHPQVILAGRRINDDMGRFIAQRLIKSLINSGIPTKGAKIGVLGVTFKENVSDIRNSRVPDIIRELEEFGVKAIVHDPMASNEDAKHEYGIELSSIDQFKDLDALVYAVPHPAFQAMAVEDLFNRIQTGGVFVDVRSAVDRAKIPEGYTYWSL